MDLIQSLEWRYAVKEFDNEKSIPADKIERIKKAFNLTPTSYGLQPLHLAIISDRELQEKLLAHSYGQKQITSASHVLVICIETCIDQNFIEANFELQKEIRSVKDEVVAPFRKFLIDDFTNRTPEEIHQWAMNQAYLALGNVLTVCAAEKIDACPMEGFEAHRYDEILGLNEKGLKSAVVLPLGYRSENDKFSGFKKVRRPINETVFEIEASKNAV